MGNKSLKLKAQKIINNTQSKYEEMVLVNPQTKILVKSILFGDKNVGKTCICKQLALNSFKKDEKPTQAIDFFVAHRDYHFKKYSINLWDTSSDHQSLGCAFFKSADAMIIVFDVTNKHSFFKTITFWIEQVSKFCTKQTSIYLIGNKSDLIYKKKVSKSIVEIQAKKRGFKYIQISSKTKYNLQEMLKLIFDNLKQQLI